MALKGRASFVLTFVAAAGCGSVGSPNIIDASACQPVTLAAPACNNLQNVASPIHAVLHSGTGVLGGPIGQLTDGIYRATALDGYRGAGSWAPARGAWTSGAVVNIEADPTQPFSRFILSWY